MVDDIVNFWVQKIGVKIIGGNCQTNSQFKILSNKKS
ncbi:hypothetical protein SaSA20_1659a [Streptococcus agalactiae]|nr:hypothetical protein SaSA20_1659a [Streptococcus agalactiae]